MPKNPVHMFKERALSKIGNLHKATSVLETGTPSEVRNLATSWGISLGESEATDLIDAYQTFYKDVPVLQIDRAPGGGAS